MVVKDVHRFILNSTYTTAEPYLFIVILQSFCASQVFVLGIFQVSKYWEALLDDGRYHFDNKFSYEFLFAICSF